MRSAWNFSPEWGYLAPVPSFARTARMILVATAIGATAGAGVVLSLVDRPAKPERTPVAARAIVTSVGAATAATPEIVAAPAAPAAAPVSGPAAQPVATPARSAVAASEVAAPATDRQAVTPQAPSHRANEPAAAASSTAEIRPAQASAPTATENAGPAKAGEANSRPAPAAGVAALSEPSAAGTATGADVPDSGTAVQEPAQKKARHHTAFNNRGSFPGLGTFFRRFFVAHSGRSYYPNH